MFRTRRLTGVTGPVDINVVIDDVGAMFSDGSYIALGILSKHPGGGEIHCPEEGIFATGVCW